MNPKSAPLLHVATFVVSVLLSAVLGIGVPALTTMLFQSRGTPIVHVASATPTSDRYALNAHGDDGDRLR